MTLRTCDGRPLAPLGTAPALPQLGSQARDERRSDQNLEVQREISYWALGAVIASWAGVVVVFLTLNATIGLLKEARETTRAAIRTAEQAEATNEITREAARHQHDASKRELRAYLSVQPDGIRPYDSANTSSRPKLGVELVGNVIITNTGRAIAQNVRWNISICCDESGDFIPSDSDEETLEGDNSISPNGSFPLTTEQISSLHFMHVDGIEKLWCYVGGKVIYEDGCGDNREITFCHRYNCEAVTSAKLLALDGSMGRHHKYGNKST